MSPSCAQDAAEAQRLPRQPIDEAARTLSAEGPVAQSVEQGTFNPKVAGSIPARPMRSETTRVAARREPGLHAAVPRLHPPSEDIENRKVMKCGKRLKS